MRLLVMSHPCITETNQQFFADVEAATGWEITLIVPANWKTEYGHGSGVKRWPAFQGEIVPVPVALPGRIPQHVYLASLSAILRRVDPQVVYAHHEPYAFATAQLRAATASVTRAAFGFYSAQNLNRQYPWPVSSLEQRAYRAASFAFPISRDVLEVLRTKGYRGPAHVLPLGVDPAIHYRTDGRSVRAQYGLDGYVFGFVGRLVPEKGLVALFRAFALLRQPDIRLLMVGEGPMRSELEALAAELGIASQIAWAGYVPHAEIARYYAAMDAAVLPSEIRPGRKEQFGRVITEALACGRPVVGSDIGEIPLLIEETGGGLVFPAGDMHGLAQAMGRMLTEPAQGVAMALVGERVVRDRFSNPAIARTFADCVREACASTRHRNQAV